MSEDKKEKKSKKVNKLNREEVSKKIQEIEAKGSISMKYYHHLILRKKEIGA